MPTPQTYASALTYVGLAAETTQGTAVAPTTTVLLTKDPSSKDNQLRLEDLGMRNSMAEMYGAVDGPLSGDMQLDGDVRTDTIGYFLGNVLGDYWATGTAGTPTTTLAALAAAGATSLSTVASIPNASVIQVGTGTNAEVFVTGTPSGAGPYTIPLDVTSGLRKNGTLAYAKASAQPVVVITTPYTYKFALQNAGTTMSQALVAQAHSLTVTDWYGPTASTGARAYPGCMFSDLAFTIDPTKLFTFSAKATTFGSAAAGATPPVTVSSLSPLAGWTCAVGIGGPASGGTLIPNVENISLDFQRQVKVYPTLGGKQPYIIRQGKFGSSGKFTLLATDESALVNYLANQQPALQMVFTNGSGATLQSITFDFAQVYYKTAAINRGGEAVEFDVDFAAIANTTNAGVSGGFSPCQVTIQNSFGIGLY